MSDIMVILFNMTVAAIGVFIAFRVAYYGLLFGKHLAYPPAARIHYFRQVAYQICVFDPSLGLDKRELLIKEACIFYGIIHTVLGVKLLPVYRLAILKDHMIEFQFPYNAAFFEPDMDNTLSYAFQRRVEIKRTHAEGDVLMEVHER